MQVCIEYAMLILKYIEWSLSYKVYITKSGDGYSVFDVGIMSFVWLTSSMPIFLLIWAKMSQECADGDSLCDAALFVVVCTLLGVSAMLMNSVFATKIGYPRYKTQNPMVYYSSAHAVFPGDRPPNCKHASFSKHSVLYREVILQWIKC